MVNNTNGLAEKLQKILNTYSEEADRFQKELDYLRQRAMFCHEHKFEEEKRITLIKTQQTEMLMIGTLNRAAGKIIY